MYSENTLWFLLHSEYSKKTKKPWFWRVGTGVKFNNHTPIWFLTNFELKQYLIPMQPRYELNSSQIQLPRASRTRTFSQPPSIHGTLTRSLARFTDAYLTSTFMKAREYIASGYKRDAYLDEYIMYYWYLHRFIPNRTLLMYLSPL